MNKPFYTYDLETYPNCFLFSGKFDEKPEVQVFEMSFRKNMKSQLLTWLSYLQNAQAIMVGFNSLGFDYPIIHQLLNEPYTFDERKAYLLCQQIINSGEYGFTSIRMAERIIAQLDLSKVNHFDNKNRRTSLKSLQVAMRSESVEDLPIAPGTMLTSEQIDQLISYNVHDVLETEKFFHKCKHQIDFRQELLDNGILKGDVLNYSDVKIGTEYLVHRIGRQKCYESGSKPRQTKRDTIVYSDIILPKIYYRTENFEQVLDWFKKQKIVVESEEKDKNPSLEAPLAGLDFHFGVGGLHASVDNKYFESNEEYVIKDIDVAGYYPDVAIQNGFEPEHLKDIFLPAYMSLKSDRKQYQKGTSMNKVLKLAGNGAFGNSDNPYSPFFDPRMPKQITINGQLQLLQLVETLSLIPRLQIIQANTDGITAYVPRDLEYLFNFWTKCWEQETRFELEYVEYSKMWIRDVNNYLALTNKGKVKRKGAYWYPETDEDYDGVWNKDFSEMIVQKAIGKVLIDNMKPEDVVRVASNKFDFMKRYKTQGGAKVYIGEKEMLKTVRYYVSIAGQPMKKISQPKGEIGAYKRKSKLSDSEYNKILKTIPPGTWDARIHTANKAKYTIVETAIESGRLVKECNKACDFNWEDVDYDYYIQEVKKLLIGD